MADYVGLLEPAANQPCRELAAKIAQLAKPDEQLHGNADVVQQVLEAMLEIAERSVAAFPISSMKMTVTSTGHRRKRMSKASELVDA